MMQLNDKDIRTLLIAKLQTQTIKPKAIVEELRIHNGNAIADVVTLYNEAHCYEIKGDGDKIERLLAQGHYYNLAFRKISLVTTLKHLEKAQKLIPYFWGIIVAIEKHNKVYLKYIRKASNNPKFDKNIALMTLWKEEMLSFMQAPKKYQNKSRETLAELIAETQHKIELSQNITLTLLDRYQTNKYNLSAYTSYVH